MYDANSREAIEGYITDLFRGHNPSDRVTKKSYVYAFGAFTLSSSSTFGRELWNELAARTRRSTSRPEFV
jgi:hypothetical protein